MSVVIETTLGDITVDLYLEHRPVTCLNFIKLCKMKYYNFNLFYSIRSGFIAQTGDPTGTGSGGQSIFGILGGHQKRFFSGEKMPKIRHTDTGLLSMVCSDDMMVGSQFFFTLAPDLDSLDGVHCVIGVVTEGHEVLRKLNDVICDDTHRPYRDVRITHTVILEDPFNDPAGFRAPSRSPSPNAERLCGGRIAPDEEIDETKGKSAAEVHEMLEEKEAKARATILEIIGDLPEADIAPPENVLFVCKLNPVTTDEDLEIIFSRFGKIVSCEVIRDKKTGDSLQYAFIEFADKKSCEDAYFKMDNVLIDDRRIHVDFSQSVSKIRWLGKGRGVKHIGEEDIKSSNHSHNDHPNQVRNNEKNYKNGKDYDSNRENNRDTKSHTDRRYRDRETHNKHEKSRNSTHNRNRSSSKSKKDKSREESTDDKYNSNKNFQHSEKVNERKYNFSKEDSSRRKKYSKLLSNRDTYSGSKHVKNIKKSGHYSEENNTKKNERKSRNDDRKNHRSNRDIENNKRNLKFSTEEKYHKHNEKQKSSHGNVEPRTPSPILEKKHQIIQNNEVQKSRDSRKKRKPSTSSSDSDSSESSSSSSSQSTCSSEQNKKKKVIKIRKRKYYSSSSSSSTSSSDSSSSSTTSSSSSSSSTSSDSNTKKRKRPKKNESKKEAYKPKKKT